MKFIKFRKLVEKYKELILQNKKTEAQEILKEIDPNNLGLKRFFIVKLHRLEKVVEKFTEDKGYKLRYQMLNITNRGYDFIITINDNKKYIIKCNTKKSLGYVHLRSLYREPDLKDGVNNLIEDYPEIVDELWETVLATCNEEKRRKIVSIDIQLMKNKEEQEDSNKENNIITQLTKQLQEQKQVIVDSLEDIDLEKANTNKI